VEAALETVESGIETLTESCAIVFP
jgi:hypothetical protein